MNDLRGLRAIPDGTPIKDGYAWFMHAGASEMFELRGYPVLPGGFVNVVHIGAQPRTGWLDRATIERLAKAIAAGEDIELLC